MFYISYNEFRDVETLYRAKKKDSLSLNLIDFELHRNAVGDFAIDLFTITWKEVIIQTRLGNLFFLRAGVILIL